MAILKLKQLHTIKPIRFYKVIDLCFYHVLDIHLKCLSAVFLTATARR